MGRLTILQKKVWEARRRLISKTNYALSNNTTRVCSSCTPSSLDFASMIELRLDVDTGQNKWKRMFWL
ncbi:hypothetical protein K443DRAFT_675237 [Laccaria amethystina LaAM-08-1]|uniref:Uncharacterized protein n=1 Tax=Laccaria amethystina LaAM-08-1 TaxID=1095629 RepID=A0A0C9XUB1_9AGAR|nr:hypothetical protein K443DRAFT_675237 [Laccaria amethystina LaAM-08-1]